MELCLGLSHSSTSNVPQCVLIDFRLPAYIWLCDLTVQAIWISSFSELHRHTCQLWLVHTKFLFSCRCWNSVDLNWTSGFSSMISQARWQILQTPVSAMSLLLLQSRKLNNGLAQNLQLHLDYLPGFPKSPDMTFCVDRIPLLMCLISFLSTVVVVSRQNQVFVAGV